jgi:hypothetical protein
MELCDRLEAARGSREAVRERLAAASLGRLNAPDPPTFLDDARFVLHALPALTTRPDQIKKLRQTILNLAVRGALTAKTPRTLATPSSEAVLNEPKPYPISDGWRWVFAQQKPREKRRLLNFLLSNCTWEDGEVVATFREPFDMLAVTAINSTRLGNGEAFKSAKNEIWLPFLDTFRTLCIEIRAVFEEMRAPEAFKG